MHKTLIYLITLLLLFCIGWMMGYMKLPYLENAYDFWIGCLMTLAIVFFIFIVKSNLKLLYLIYFNKKQPVKIPRQNYNLFGVLYFPTFTFIALICLFVIYHRKTTFSETQIANEHKIYSLEQSLILSKQSQKLHLLLDLINQFESKSEIIARNNILERIITLSYSFKDFIPIDTCDLLAQKYSVERGQLLLAIVSTKMDSNSFKKIKKNISFSRADLAKVNLQGKDLSGIDLRMANFQEANLESVNLSNSDVSMANLKSANLENANLSFANFQRSNLSSAIIKNANLVNTLLDSANLKSVNLRKSNLENASMIWSTLDYALMQEANLTNCIMNLSSLIRTNLSKATLLNTRLSQLKFEEINLSNALFNNNFMNDLVLYDQPLADYIKTNYTLINFEKKNTDSAEFCILKLRSE